MKNKRNIIDMNPKMYQFDIISKNMDMVINGHEISNKMLEDMPSFEDYQWELWDKENKAIVKIIVWGIVFSVPYIIFISQLENICKGVYV